MSLFRTLLGVCVLSAGCANGAVSTDDGPAGAGGIITGVGGSGGAGAGAADGLPLGATCAMDEDCASNICEEVFLDLPDKVCVARCGDQGDCPEGDAFFCEAISPGAMDGYCIPRSPAHCAGCEQNADCGYFTEVCLEGPDDDAKACHVDCSLAGEAACPQDYTCNQWMIGNTTRELCVPNEPRCVDALGGYCDNVDQPLGCARESGDGTCVGERSCGEDDRYTVCGASEPQCKASCDASDPPGCVLEACGDIASTVEHCGMCNNPCPGIGVSNGLPSCIGETCAFACQGESYDVDGDIANGCEQVDSVLGNHSQATGVSVGSFPCSDGSSNRNIAGSLHSDMRSHDSPPISDFDATTGSAPDWYNLFADGGLCQNEVVLTLAVTGSGDLACYRLAVFTSNGNHACSTDASGRCTINQDGTGVYDDDTTIHIRVDKTCPASSPGAVTYSVTGHL